VSTGGIIMNQEPNMGMQSKPAVSKWLWISLIIVIVLAAGFAAWYYLSGPGKTVATTETTTPTTTTMPTTTTAATSTTADWKTYTDKTFGYSVKYPANWLVNSTNPRQIEFRENGKTYSIEESDIYAIVIAIDDKVQAKTALELANERKANMTVGAPVVTETIVDNVKAAQIQDYLQKSMIIVNSNKRYDIVTPNFGVEEINKGVQKVYDQMISTFRFTK